eukprot:4850082-Amphidinium_carterae.1
MIWGLGAFHGVRNVMTVGTSTLFCAACPMKKRFSVSAENHKGCGAVMCSPSSGLSSDCSTSAMVRLLTVYE